MKFYKQYNQLGCLLAIQMFPIVIGYCILYMYSIVSLFTFHFNWNYCQQLLEAVVVVTNIIYVWVYAYSLHPLFPGSNEVDQIAKIHDIMGTPAQTVLDKLKQ